MEGEDPFSLKLPPHSFIDWALSKKYEIEWLRWAEDWRLYKTNFCTVSDSNGVYETIKNIRSELYDLNSELLRMRAEN